MNLKTIKKILVHFIAVVLTSIFVWG